MWEVGVKKNAEKCLHTETMLPTVAITETKSKKQNEFLDQTGKKGNEFVVTTIAFKHASLISTFHSHFQVTAQCTYLLLAISSTAMCVQQKKCRESGQFEFKQYSVASKSSN